MIDIRLLGPLEVSGPDARQIEIPSKPQRRLVSALALHVGSVVRGATLEDRLDLSAGALRTSISRLRRLLGPDALTTTPPGYALDARVDVTEFDRLTALAPSLHDDAARSVLEQAMCLWRGPPLDEFSSDPWAAAAVARLHEVWATAVEDLAVLQLDAGETSIALAGIRSLIDDDPYRDRPQALLLRALCEAGRRTEALRSFQTYRRLLLDDIGTEPSRSVNALDRTIAAADPAWTPAPPFPDHPAWNRTRLHVATERRRAPRLPVPVSSFIGRSDEVAALSALLDTQRLVTLTGAGGCGKTRLALAVADATLDRYPGGAWWVALGPLTSSAQVLETVASSTGHTATSGADLTDQLVGRLDTDQPSLLVLDNAEHVLETVDALVAELLVRCPCLTVLVTSREPLGPAGELVWRVPPLDTSDARALFLERAREARPTLLVDDDADAHVAAICAGLDGLPLALELAAARTRTLPLSTVAQGVGDAVRWQASGSRSTLAQHATLHASISWSVDLLDPIARTVLVRLSVFESAFTLQSAIAVAGAGHTDDELAASISTLVDASLVELDDATARYRMLRIVRQFCALRAQGTADLDATRRRNVHRVADWCTEVGDGRRGIERGPLIVEMPDVVAAMQWARREEPIEVLRMCAGLAAVRSALGYNANVLETWEWLMSLDRAAAATDGWAAEWAAAVAALMAPATAQSIDVGTVADEVRRLLPADRRRELGWLARGAAMAPAYRGHVKPILAHAEEAARRGDEMEISIYGGFAAYMLSMMGRSDDLEVRLDELRRLTRRRHTAFSVDTVGNGYVGAVLGDLNQGELRAAARRATDRIPDDPAFSMTAAAALAQVALHTGDRATMACAVAWSRQETIPMLRYLPILIDLTATVTDGSTETAADLAEDYWEESAHVPVSRCHPLPLLTSALLAAGRLDAATSCVEAADGLVHDMDPAPWLRAGVLHGRAQLALHRGHRDELALHASDLAQLAATQSFATMAIDASELTAAALGPSTDRTRLLADTDAARQRLGYRWRPLAHAAGGTDAQV